MEFDTTFYLAIIGLGLPYLVGGVLAYFAIRQKVAVLEVKLESLREEIMHVKKLIMNGT